MKNLILICAICTSFALCAQPNNPNNPTPLPGIALLVAAGAAYGAKKMYDQKEE
jgi:hypothetical protein